jgi:hypothetical protein
VADTTPCSTIDPGYWSGDGPEIVLSNCVRRHQQGIAAPLISTLNLYGNGLGLGFAGSVETEVNKYESDQVHGYRASLCFGFPLAAVALFFHIVFVRIVSDQREGWVDVDDNDGVSRSTSSGTELLNGTTSRQFVNRGFGA